MRDVSVVLIKPTRECNADCSYCCAPPDDTGYMSIDEFKGYFDTMLPNLHKNADIIWHGGEPTLLEPDFYREVFTYAKEKLPGVRFAMQSNILSYSTSRWKDVFENVFEGRISTSYEFVEGGRTMKGDAKLYGRLFRERLQSMIVDGFRPMVIGTYSEATAFSAMDMYDWSTGLEGKPFDLRFNYMTPTGRLDGADSQISPENHGEMLVELYNKWLLDDSDISITPLDQMLKKVVGMNEDGQCPWTKSCVGSFMAIEPDGQVYNCCEFSDMKASGFSFGNIKTMTVPELMHSDNARALSRREYLVPDECQTCRHFEVCEGGCMRDSVKFGNGLYGKFQYCASWMMIFDRIKESVLNGEAAKRLDIMGYDIEQAKRFSQSTNFIPIRAI